MSELKTNKFKVGDKVEIVSVNSTVAEYGGADYLAPIGTIDNISWVNDDGLMIELESDNYLYSSKDLRLIADEETTTTSKTLYSPLNVQQSGDHYKKKGIQPIEYGFANNLSFPQINIVKYVSRHEDKNGLDDLAKSIHYHFFEALRVYGEEGSDQLRKKVLELLDTKQGEVG